jgi:hypothetical protein
MCVYLTIWKTRELLSFSSKSHWKLYEAQKHKSMKTQQHTRAKHTAQDLTFVKELSTLQKFLWRTSPPKVQKMLKGHTCRVSPRICTQQRVSRHCFLLGLLGFGLWASPHCFRIRVFCFLWMSVSRLAVEVDSPSEPATVVTTW